MDSFRIFDDKQEVADAVAQQTVVLLEQVIKTYGIAVWVLAGGSIPLLAYEVIAKKYKDEIDWTKVTVIIGDERIGDLNGPDNNWHAIEKILLNELPVTKIRPESSLHAVDAARRYEDALDTLPKTSTGLPRLDVVWLGMGQDGHTLSLFPNHDSLLPSKQLVIPVSNSPKPPSNRITLTLRALTATKTALIITGGSDKQEAVTKARSGVQLPIALAVNVITTHQGNVRWLIDKSAAPAD
jgi:6-phosphogluconolactonase